MITMDKNKINILIEFLKRWLVTDRYNQVPFHLLCYFLAQEWDTKITYKDYVKFTKCSYNSVRRWFIFLGRDGVIRPVRCFDPFEEYWMLNEDYVKEKR